MVAAGVPAAGLRGGWRDCCIVNAPERSGLGAVVVLRALVVLPDGGLREGQSRFAQFGYEDGEGLVVRSIGTVADGDADGLVGGTHQLRPGRGAWLQIAEGVLSFNGVELTTGDGASTETPGTLTLTATKATEAILFDLK